MSWYYTIANERMGPLEDHEFNTMVQQGVIRPRTLVWREGMAGWQPFSAVAQAGSSVLAANPSLPGNYSHCAECGRAVPEEDLVPIGERNICAACKPVIVQRVREGVLSNPHAETIRKQYIRHEASVKSVGVLYLFGAVFILFVALAGLAGITPERASQKAASLPASIFLIVWSVFQFWVGRNLNRLRKWSRIPVGILSAIGLLAIPFGTLINAYILYLVFGKKGQMVFSDEYQQIIAATPHVKYRTSIVVWIFLGLLILILGFIIATAVLR